MAAAKKPLEFHAKRPWRGEEAVDDPDEDNEEDNDEAENGFSLEEVLRLGGTKVMASDSRTGKGDRVRGVVSRVVWPPPSGSVGGRLALRSQLRNVRFPHFFSHCCL